MSKSWYDPDGIWRRQLFTRLGDPDEYRCTKCGHTDDHRREAHYSTCPSVAERAQEPR